MGEPHIGPSRGKSQGRVFSAPLNERGYTNIRYGCRKPTTPLQKAVVGRSPISANLFRIFVKTHTKSSS
jgi:hypothetical protein